MTNKFKLAVLLLAGFYNFSGVAQALPDMTATEVKDWILKNASINSPRATEQNEPGMSYLDSSTQMMGGTVHLTIFMNDRDRVEAENIDYRPDCYPTPGCSGTTRFEKADRSTGQDLILAVWGQRVLDDFQSSTLIETDTTTGTKRWYQGSLYNYETWHYNNYTIVHFGVVSKQSSQTDRIDRYRYCIRNYC